MTGTKSLRQLKEENAETEIEEVEMDEAEQGLESVTATTDDIEEEAVDIDSDDTDEAVEEEVEIESWMQAGEANTDDDKKGGFKPNHGAARKRLKAKIGEKDDELAAAKAEIERLRSGSTEQKTAALPARPKREDFDYDDDAYDAAVDDWNDKKLDARLSSHSHKSEESQRQESAAKAQAERVESSLNSHYARKDKLVSEGKVSEDAYDTAELNVRNAMERLYPNTGDKVVDNLITTLNSIGEGSEKVMYQLGVNPSKLLELQNKIASDPSGFTAVAYLGSLQSQISTPTRKRSSAPRPAAKVDGEGGVSNAARSIKKAYDKADKSGDIQARFNERRKAKAQGIDTTNW